MTRMRPQIVAAASISPVERGAVGPTGVRGTCPRPRPIQEHFGLAKDLSTTTPRSAAARSVSRRAPRGEGTTCRVEPSTLADTTMLDPSVAGAAAFLLRMRS
jgi:hypothetical protein